MRRNARKPIDLNVPLSMESLIITQIQKTGLSLRKFAQQAGMPLSSLNSIIYNDEGVSKASFKNVVRICSALGFDIRLLSNEVNLLNSESASSDKPFVLSIGEALLIQSFRKADPTAQNIALAILDYGAKE